MVRRRCELRYAVPEDTAVALRDYVRGNLKLDEHCTARENFSYEVHSVYFDSDRLQLYWSSINGDENQLRLRLRFYGDNPDASVFVETKQRLKEYFVKERVAIRACAVASLLSQRNSNPDSLISRTRNHMVVLDRWCKIAQNPNAKPKVHVAFNREAYRTPSASVTFDRLVRAEPASATGLSSEMQHPTLLFGDDVVVELKFMDEQPDFFRQIIHDFGLRSSGAEKYVDGLALIGERCLGS